jgi:Ran GTPase-activating protein (RanGAP) involved in mRNA processing and transport
MLSEGLTYTTGLSALSLNHVNVGEKGAIAFAEYYGDRRNTSLANLELIGAHINDAGITELGTTLKKCSFLQKLFLADNPITEAGTPAVGALFAHSPTLTSLDLGGMKWGDRGITPIMTALQTNKSLTLLDVSGNDLKMAVRSFVDILQVRNTTLQTLVIGANDIDEDYKKVLLFFHSTAWLERTLVTVGGFR